MGKIYFVRHGETEWNIERRMQGHKNSPLSKLGLKQAYWLSEEIVDEKLDYIYASTLQRALDTANIIKNNRNIEIIPREELKEIALGEWEGMRIEKVEQEYPDRHFNFWKSPDLFEPLGGESFDELVERAGKFVDEISVKHKNDNILIVAHAVVIKAIINYIRKKEIRDFWRDEIIMPTSLSLVNNVDGELQIKFVGDTSHYKEENETGKWFVEKE